MSDQPVEENSTGQHSQQKYMPSESSQIRNISRRAAADHWDRLYLIVVVRFMGQIYNSLELFGTP